WPRPYQITPSLVLAGATVVVVVVAEIGVAASVACRATPQPSQAAGIILVRIRIGVAVPLAPVGPVTLLAAVRALEANLRLHVGIDAGVALAVGDEADLGLDLERERGEEPRDLVGEVDVGEELADLARDDLEDLV